MLDESYLAELEMLVEGQRFRIVLQDDAFGAMTVLLHLFYANIIVLTRDEFFFLGSMRLAIRWDGVAPGPWIIVQGENWNAREFWRKMWEYLDALEVLPPPPPPPEEAMV